MGQEKCETCALLGWLSLIGRKASCWVNPCKEDKKEEKKKKKTKLELSLNLLTTCESYRCEAHILIYYETPPKDKGCMK